MEFIRTLHTDGKGLWSRKVAAVKTLDLQVDDYSNIDVEDGVIEESYGELRVYFDTKTWNIHDDGLIYTDKLFISELQAALIEIGVDVSDMWYSEQGMQEVDYVSLDIGSKFINSWNAIQ